MKLSHVTFASLLLSIALLFGVAEYFIYLDQQEVKAALIDLTTKVYGIQEEKSRIIASPQVISSGSGSIPQAWGNKQKQVQDTVVQLFVQRADFNWLEPYKVPRHGGALGSGFLISETGEIVTNAHVVNQSVMIHAQIPSFGKHQFEVDLVGIMPEKDFAIVKLRQEGLDLIRAQLSKIPYLNLGDSDLMRRADEIMALGYPLGQQSLKSTTGVISGREAGMIQMSAAINPGSSGGPAIDGKGDVIGINTAGIQSAQNVGYIIPINDLKVFLQELRTEKLVRKPYLGIMQSIATEDLTRCLGNPLPGGVYIVAVHSDSPLEGKLQVGDMIYEINGLKVDSYGEMQVPWSEDKIATAEYVARLSLGQKVSFVVYRNGKRETFSCTFNHKELAPIRQMFPGYEKIEYEVFGGLVVMQLSLNHIPLLLSSAPGLAKFAEDKNQSQPLLVVTHVMQNSPAQRSRLPLAGSILKNVDEKPVSTLQELQDVIADASEIIKIETTDNAVIALSRKDIVENEPRLARAYAYEISPGVQKLIAKEIAAHDKSNE